MNIIELSDGTLINLREVVMIGPVGGDPAWLSYRVYFRGSNIQLRNGVKHNQKSQKVLS